MLQVENKKKEKKKNKKHHIQVNLKYVQYWTEFSQLNSKPAPQLIAYLSFSRSVALLRYTGSFNKLKQVEEVGRRQFPELEPCWSPRKLLNELRNACPGG